MSKKIFAVSSLHPSQRNNYAANLSLQLKADYRNLTTSRSINNLRSQLTELSQATELSPARAATNETENLVIELPNEFEPTQFIAWVLNNRVQLELAELLVVVDARSFISDLMDESFCWRYNLDPEVAPTEQNEFVSRAHVLIEQIEYSSSILLQNWTTLAEEELTMLKELLQLLSPKSKLLLDGKSNQLNSHYNFSTANPGWVSILNQEDPPKTLNKFGETSRVSAFKYENLMPFHPERLFDLFHSDIAFGRFGSLIRSVGFSTLATRSEYIGLWDHVSNSISFNPLSRSKEQLSEDSIISIGQEFAFIGIDLDQDALSAALDQCALTPDEWSQGTELWQQFPDPFPGWHMNNSHEH